MSGVIVELEDQKDSQWRLLALSVGDCKIFHWNSQTRRVTDVTEGNRSNLLDPRDPGGRLGPFLSQGDPDWRNLALYSFPCTPGDMIMAVSGWMTSSLTL